MLTEISIRDLGVIPDATVEFSPGFTVLTGETGAGKTMVVTSLKLLSGHRADPSRVRTGAEKTVVEGRIATDGMDSETIERIEAIASDLGGERDENEEFILARQVSAKGRSKAWVGGRATSAATLGEFAGHAIAIHGQNNQLRLLGANQQRAALDRFDAENIAPLLTKYRELRGTWRGLAKELEEKTTKRRELAQRADQLQFAINEINNVDPVAGEDEELVETIRRMQDLDGLRDAATTALASIDGAGALDTGAGAGGDFGDGEAAADLLGAAQAELAAASDTELQQIAEQIGEITSALSDISGQLGAYVASLPDEAADLDQLMQRQADLKTLTRKYAPDLAGVIAWRDKAERALASLDVSTEAITELKEKVQAAEKKLAAAAKKLTTARTKAAKTLAAAVTEELHGLAMPNSSLSVQLSQADSFGPHGKDEVEFCLKAFAKAEPKPLASSASGGELSRIMLALEVVLARGESGQTMIFDEVDAGVGGRAAVEIGKRLAKLAKNNQVIVVTHLPQVAAFADTHLVVAKNIGEDAVTSAVTSLSDEERVEELARMMAGLDGTESGRAHAKELLVQARRAFDE